jgi:hypothetical protein
LGQKKKVWKGKIENARCKVHDNGVGENGRDNATSEASKMQRQQQGKCNNNDTTNLTMTNKTQPKQQGD